MMKEALFSSTELKTGCDRVIAAWQIGYTMFMVTKAGRVYQLDTGKNPHQGKWLDWEEAET